MKIQKTNIKEQCVGLGRIWIEFAEYIKNNAFVAGMLAVAILLIYSGQAFNEYFYVDKEALINYPRTFYNWDEIGRFGLILMKKLLGLSWYNPYAAGVLLLITLWLDAMLACYLFYSIDNRIKSSRIGIFALIILICPTYTEQFLFQIQAFEVMLGEMLILISALLLLYAIRNKSVVAFVLSMPLVVISFGIYQSMVPIQLCLYMGMFLFLIYQNEAQRELVGRIIGLSVVHFTICIVVYSVIYKMWFDSGNYLNSQIVWQTMGVEAAIRGIKDYTKGLVGALGSFYTYAYDIAWIIGLIAFLVLFIRLRLKSFWYGLGLLGVVISPLFLPIVLGSSVGARTQLVLPWACAILWLFSIQTLSIELKSGFKSIGGGYCLLQDAL